MFNVILGKLVQTQSRWKAQSTFIFGITSCRLALPARTPFTSFWDAPTDLAGKFKSWTYSTVSSVCRKIHRKVHPTFFICGERRDVFFYSVGEKEIKLSIRVRQPSSSTPTVTHPQPRNDLACHVCLHDCSSTPFSDFSFVLFFFVYCEFCLKKKLSP